MFAKIKQFVSFITLFGVFACTNSNPKLTKISAEGISITDTIVSVDSIVTYLAPYRNRINQVLDSSLAFVTSDLVKTDGKRNTSAGNFLADVVLEQANPIFNKRTGKSVDFVVLNHGGIRAIVSKGPVNARTAYQIMPFENNVVVVEMPGKSVRQLLDFLVKSGRAHPVANTKLIVDANNTYVKTEINGRPFDETRIYYVATNDYLVQGGDDMGFFKDRTATTNLDYLVRNAIIDYFKKVDTISKTVDDRFIQIN